MHYESTVNRHTRLQVPEVFVGDKKERERKLRAVSLYMYTCILYMYVRYERVLTPV